MTFLFPWVLLGAAGASVPVVIHLLNRYRFRVVEWGAMELLRRALVVRAQRVRLEDVLLMMLRGLVLLLIPLALARPSLSSAGGSGRGEVGAVIAIDGSSSTSHKPGVQSRFDRALDRARDIGRTV